MKKNIFVLSTVLSAMIGYSANSMADDIDIYLTGQKTKSIFSNSMIIVDSSDSMSEMTPEGLNTKMYSAKQSVIALIASLNDEKRIGLSTYNGDGASILYPVAALNERVYQPSVSTIYNNVDDFIERSDNAGQKTGYKMLGFGMHGVPEEVKTYEKFLTNDNQTATQCKDGSNFDMSSSLLYFGLMGSTPCADAWESSMLFKFQLPYGAKLRGSYVELTKTFPTKMWGNRNVRLSMDLYNNIGGENDQGDAHDLFNDGEPQQRCTGYTIIEKVDPIYYEGTITTPGVAYSKTCNGYVSYSREVDMQEEERTEADGSKTTVGNSLKGIDFDFDWVSTGADAKMKTPNLDQFINTWTTYNELLIKLSTIIHAPYETTDYQQYYASNTNTLVAPKLSIDYVEQDGNYESNTNYVGMKFNDINIASHSNVAKGELKLRPSETFVGGNDLKVSIMAHSQDAGGNFTGTIVGATVLATKDFNNLTWDLGTTVTLDVADIVEEAITKNGFCGGDDLLFVFESSTLPGIMAREVGSSYNTASLRLEQGAVTNNSCAKLTLYSDDDFESIVSYTKTRYGEDALYTVREKLVKIIMDDIKMGGATPTVGSTLEVFNYFTGGEVSANAKKRHTYVKGSNSVHGNKNKRVSHPNSYDGTNVSVYNSLGCGDSTYGTDSCKYETISGTTNYISPLTNLECEVNNIVMLTDGTPYEDGTYYSEVNTITGGSCNDSWSCIIDLTRHMAETDLMSGMSNSQIITTDVIGFALDSDPDTLAKLTEYAEAGDGQYLSVHNSLDLTMIMYEILDNVLDVTTVALPGVAVDQANKLQLKDDLYFSLFVPSELLSWEGNLKKYAISNFQIVDVNQTPAIDPDTGMFIEETMSHWSTANDGADSTAGGAGNLTTTDRNIFTYLDSNITNVNIKLSGSQHRFTDSNSLLNQKSIVNYTDNAGDAASVERSDYMKDMLNGLWSNDVVVSNAIKEISTNDPDRYFGDLQNLDNFLAWIRGVDVFDKDADDDSLEARNPMSDPLHVKPIVVNYTDTESTLFVSTNDGTLHGIDTNTGEELFAFVPKEMIPNLYKKAYLNTKGSHQYGLDLTWVAYRHDDDLDGDITANSSDFVKIYGGMRRGGSSLYSLDVTNIYQGSPDVVPTFNWEINESVSGFENMGQTWSIPIITQVRIGGVDKIVLIFGGGYDVENDQHNNTLGQKGSQIYMIDAEDGSLLWSAGGAGDSGADLQITGMDYSIPNKLEMLDMDNDGFVDYIYANDTAGQIFKIKVDNDGNSSAASLAEGKIFAKLGKSNSGVLAEDRKFYDKITIVPVIDQEGKALYIATGTGYRARPFNRDNKDAIFVLKDREIDPSSFDVNKTPITMSALVDLTVNNDADVDILNALTNKEGFYIWLNAGKETSDGSFEGEKMMGNITATNNKLLFTTYVPNSDMFEETTVVSTKSYLWHRTAWYYASRNRDSITPILTTNCATGKYTGCYTQSDYHTPVMDGSAGVTNKELLEFQAEYMEMSTLYKTLLLNDFDNHETDILKTTTYFDSYTADILSWTDGSAYIFYFEDHEENEIYVRQNAHRATVVDNPLMSLNGGTNIDSSTENVSLVLKRSPNADYCDDSGLGETRKYAINIYTGKPETMNQDAVLDPTQTIIEQRYTVEAISGFSAGTKILYTSDGVVAITNTNVELVDDVNGLGLFKNKWLRLLRDDEAIVPAHITVKRSGL